MRTTTESGDPAPSANETRIPVYDAIELRGELGIALWSSGSRARACAVLRHLAADLLSNWQPTDPRFREVFHKTAHVLGWLAPVAAGGSPPLHVRDGGEYVSPSPGIFNRKRPALADLESPILRAVVALFIGRILAGVGFDASALKWLRTASEIARVENSWWILPQILLNQAPLEAIFGKAKNSVSDAVEGIRLVVSIETLVSQGQDLRSINTDPSHVWELLSTEAKAAAQLEVFWLAIIPWRISALDSADDAKKKAWSEALQTPELQDNQFWKGVFGVVFADSDKRRRAEIIQAINALPGSDYFQRIGLFLALLNSEGCLPSDALTVHISVFLPLAQRLQRLPASVRRFSRQIVDYWRLVAETRGFQLRSPSIFRSRMSSIGLDANHVDACQVLIWAEEATGVTVPTEYRRKLLEQLSSA